ncbi:MAG: beta-lactamase family protein [Lentisphaeria bacterium]|nr:beta-lactamase family protein [Lentisphaeria bacterium]
MRVYDMKQNGETLKFLKHFESLGIPGMDCAVFRHGKPVFRYSSGFSDEAGLHPVDGSERYNIYSCSKLITCTAALLLVEKDIIRLDDALYDYLPEFKQMTKCVDGKIEDVRNTITLRHLFSMTAGFTYNVASENLKRGISETNGTMPTREAMKYLACDPLAFEPGSSWQYSLCHDVLAAVVEVASGKRFGEFVKENIFDVAGMKRSTFLLPDEELSEIAAQYRYDSLRGQYVFCGPQIQNYKFGSAYESGGAGCVSTVDDYIAFLEALREGRLLKAGTIARMTSPQISLAAESAHLNFHPDANYSYGLGVRCPRPGGIARDYGWGGAAGAFLAIWPQEEMTLFYVQHVLGSPVQPIRMQLRDCVLKDIN